MFSNPIALLLFAVFVLQGCNARPYQNEDSAVHALEERLDLAHFFFTWETELELVAIKHLKSALEEVLQDPKVLEIQSDKMKSNLDEIRNLIEDIKQFEKEKEFNKKKLRDLLNTFNSIKHKYDVEEIKGPENIIIKKSFDAASLKYIKLMEARLKEAVEKLLAEIEKYIEGLTEEQRKDESEFLHWAGALKAVETDSGRAFKVRELIEDFQLNDFLW